MSPSFDEQYASIQNALAALDGEYRACADATERYLQADGADVPERLEQLAIDYLSQYADPELRKDHDIIAVAKEAIALIEERRRNLTQDRLQLSMTIAPISLGIRGITGSLGIRVIAVMQEVFLEKLDDLNRMIVHVSGDELPEPRTKSQLGDATKLLALIHAAKEVFLYAGIAVNASVVHVTEYREVLGDYSEELPERRVALVADAAKKAVLERMAEVTNEEALQAVLVAAGIAAPGVALITQVVMLGADIAQRVRDAEERQSISRNRDDDLFRLRRQLKQHLDGLNDTLELLEVTRDNVLDLFTNA